MAFWVFFNKRDFEKYPEGPADEVVPRSIVFVFFLVGESNRTSLCFYSRGTGADPESLESEGRDPNSGKWGPENGI